MSVIEILTFTASEAFKKDPDLSHELFELLRPTKGLQQYVMSALLDRIIRHIDLPTFIYVATGIEEPDTRWFLLVWETYEDHEALMDHKDYPKVGEKLAPLLADGFKMHHVSFSHMTRIALTSPVSEIVTLEVKEKENPEKKAAFEGVMLDMIDHSHRAPRAKEHPPFAFGQTREHPSLYYFLGGWTTVEHHTLCVDDPEGIKSHVKQIGELATFKVNHEGVWTSQRLRRKTG